MTLKGNAKFKVKLICASKNNIRNLVNFHVNSPNSENLNFYGLLLSKACKDLDEKVQKKLCLITLKSDTKFEEKLNPWFRK